VVHWWPAWPCSTGHAPLGSMLVHVQQAGTCAAIGHMSEYDTEQLYCMDSVTSAWPAHCSAAAHHLTAPVQPLPPRVVCRLLP
jgi:hypothetical protein